MPPKPVPVPQVSDSVFTQDRHESLNDIPRHGDGPRQMRFTHILNPHVGRTTHESELQALTFETIRIAARLAAPYVQVRCVCVTDASETGTVPADCVTAEPLTRTVLDIAAFHVPTSLPLVFDILDNGVAVPEAPAEIAGCEDFIIFTNTDIHLQPHFYLGVRELIQAGYDVMDIHRREIPRYVPRLDSLPSMFGEIGIHHGGCDCIVFPRKMYSAFVRNNACVGRSYVMRALVFNLVKQARRMLIAGNTRLTFHLGNERAWSDPRLADYTDFNLAESGRALTAMAADKATATRMLAALRVIGIHQDFLRMLEQAAGLVVAPTVLRQVAWRKLRGARRRSAKAIIRLLARWEH